MIRNGSNQVAHLIQGTTWESDKNTIKIQASFISPVQFVINLLKTFDMATMMQYFANENMSVSANVSFVGLMPLMNLLRLMVHVEYIKLMIETDQ